MNSFLSMPDWVPWWVPLVLVVLALFYALAFMVMPFSVLGVKPRLDAIDARLDEIQHDIRILAARLPAGSAQLDFEDVYSSTVTPSNRREASPFDRPPIPPSVRDIYADDDDYDGPIERPAPPPHMRPIRREAAVIRQERVEPRLDRRR